jgi:hypothetical protein
MVIYRWLVLIISFIFVVGCASQPEKLQTSHVSTVKYNHYECEQIAAEILSVERRRNELYISLKSEADTDVTQMWVGMLLLWPALLFLEGGDGAEAAEYSQLKGEYAALEQSSILKKCGYQSTGQTQSELIAVTESEPSELFGGQREINGQELADDMAAKSSSSLAKDTVAPVINVPKSMTVDSDRPTIWGRVTDNEKVAQLTVEGRVIDISPDGSFSFERFVPSGGATVAIEATDEWGNRSEKSVQLIRDMFVSTPVFAELDPTGFSVEENPNAVALIIGIADYKDVVAANYADRDAKMFGDYARRKLGVPASNIKVLTNEGADISDIIKATRVWLPQAARAGASDIYVFFAGHGLGSEDGSEIYLLPYSGVPEVLDRTALLRSELFSSLTSVNPRSVTVFLDTCYSGTSRDEEALMAARPVMLVAKEQAIPAGFTVFSAASMKQTAKMLPEAEHGLFSYYLMKGMEGDADTNSDNTITAGELHNYILRKAIRLQRNQTPQMQGDADRVLVQW